MPAAETRPLDLVLAGGGLANGLIAWRLHQLRPELRIRVLESGPTLGGNHTWSFHDGDVSPAQLAWLQPLVAHHWPRYDVRFAARSRRLESGYNSVTSGRFHAVIGAALGRAVRYDTSLAEVLPTEVRQADGRVVRAGAVLDGRGYTPCTRLQMRCQKFVGLELRLAAPHGLDAPILMDARVPQLDGYRFVYTLPLAPDRLLVEDTYYADATELHRDALRLRVLDYARAQGWHVAEVLREESGVLPIAIDGDIGGFWSDRQGQPCSGMRAGLFHPTTGYSLPQAVRLADFVAAQADLSAPALARAIERHGRQTWRRQTLFRALNRMLFLADRPETRHRILSHFYRLPDGLVARFYGERLTATDWLRIVSGRPPVPIHSAVKVLLPPRRPGHTA